MALSIPATDVAMQNEVDFDQAQIDAMSITNRYSHKEALLCMLDNIGCGYKEKFRLLHDGFDSMKAIVDHFQGDIDGFKKQLINGNKIWMNNGLTRMRAFFSPVLINKLVGVMYYFNTAVKIFHCIPDINLITSDEAT